ncbi:putative disease resistance RPP13-like protein 1 [Zingiber officinale]|uniref:putative disease resistance RPP13-like protein 1 n=1 Tax=Zingiber officinale TaxID=94328 RepID=UPI001C4BE0C9|nr:putative disease resistance RPP13-like protein 1 [Zingiber officinale]
MDEESGWNLLKHLVFESEGDEDEISSFEEIGIKLVNKCDGLPLAIKAIAGVLYQQDKAKWVEILQNMYSKEIVQSWVAEGLIMDEQDQLRRDLPIENQRTMEEIGEEMYRELICRNLLEADASFDLSKSFFSMHDHFRSLSANLMREEGILYRHAEILRQACLRTLILIDSPKTKTIEDSVLQALPCLRVLDLTKTSIEKIPDCIGDLLHLRYLDLDGTNICEIPTSIGNLVNLQSLDISVCMYLERLPESIAKLHNLRRLDISCCPLLTYVPKGIGKLENLYSLHGFMVGQNNSTSEKGCDLEELKNLSKLRSITIDRLERAEGGASALANKPFLKQLSLSWMQPDEEEEVDNGRGDDAKANEEADGDGTYDEDANNDMGDGKDDGYGQGNESEEAGDTSTGSEVENEETENEEKVWSEEQISKAERICNEMTQPSSTIFNILFRQYPGRQFPSWMTSSSLAESFPNLTYLKLLGLPCCTELPPFGTLPQLKYLNIERASSITAIGSQFLGSRSSAFPKLEVLQFEDMPRWEEWTFNGAPLAVKLFPSLRACAIIDCPKLRALPDGLHRATNLNQLGLLQTYELGEINNITLAYRLEVTNGIGLKKISNIPSLRYLEVNDCPNLECVENLGKLQHLDLVCSEEMEQLPLWLRGLIEQHNNTASTHRSLKKFEMRCNRQLLKSCLEGNENWDIIEQIPNVKVQTYSGQEYLFYTKDPYNYDAKIDSTPTMATLRQKINALRQLQLSQIQA